MRELKVSDVKWTIKCREEDIPIKGNICASGDDEFDRQEEEKIRKRLYYTQWAWCCVEVIGEFRGITATDVIGGCSYKNEEDFKQSEYYKDMQNIILEELQDKIEDISDWYNCTPLNFVI